MSLNEILDEINLLPPHDKIWLVQQTLKSLHDRISKEELSMAAEFMAEEYKTNSDLTVFTKIDFETFYEAR